MDVSMIVRNNPYTATGNLSIKRGNGSEGKATLQANPNPSLEVPRGEGLLILSDNSPNRVNRELAIEDNFLSREEATNAAIANFSFSSFSEARKAGRQAAIDAATGEEKKDLQMRMYWSEYTDIFTGGSPNGWGRIDMETMYSQASEIYRQIEESSDDEETKALKLKALENALSTGTSMYKMRVVGEKMKADALEAEAQGKAIDRSYRSKAKFDKLSEMSNIFHDITKMFFNNLKSGITEGFNYGSIITDAAHKIMSYKHPE